jgi:hypothetical protein
MQTMQREVVIITPEELNDIMKGFSLQTLCIYLDNYKFSKFRIDTVPIRKCRYKVCDEFLSLLYTTLLRRSRVTEARKLKAYFNTYNIKHLDYEV